MYDFYYGFSSPEPKGKYTPLSQDAIAQLKELSVSFENKQLFDGYQYTANFPNGYGIDIIKHQHSFGRLNDQFEIAVLKDGKLCYDTEITDDVIGYLPETEVLDYAMRIYKLS